MTWACDRDHQAKLNFFSSSVVYFFDEGTMGGPKAMRNGKHIRSRGPRLMSPDRRKTVVIADGGGEVNLVLLDASQSADTGSCFDHGGRRWVILGRRHHSRVLVAEPLTEVQQ